MVGGIGGEKSKIGTSFDLFLLQLYCLPMWPNTPLPRPDYPLQDELRAANKIRANTYSDGSTSLTVRFRPLSHSLNQILTNPRLT
jgi:hypothetical protein